jgi:hypothetical protein
MRNSLRLFSAIGISIVSVFLVTSSTRGQQHVTFLVGPEAGYNFVFYYSDPFLLLNSGPLTLTSHNGFGNGYFWGLTAEDPLSADMRHFLIFDAGYDTKPATFFTSSNDAFRDSTETVSSASLWTKLSYITVNLGYKYNFLADSIPNGLGIQLCLSIGIKYESDFWKSVSSWNQQQPEISATAITDANALRLALRPEITYDRSLTNSWVLTPFAGYELALTKVNADQNWTASALYVGLALRYAIW